MWKSVMAASTVIILAPIVALGAPATRQPGSGYPLLSGAYLLQTTTICQPSLNVTYNDQGGVTGVNLVPAGDAGNTTTGQFTATQGKTKGTGTISLTATSASGDPIIVTSINGEQGQALGVGTGSDNVSFKQTATTLALTDPGGTSTYNIYYGTAVGKDVGFAVFSGLDYKGCAASGNVTLVQ